MYREGFSRHRIVAVVTIVLILGVFLTRLPQTNAQFIIAGWDYDDGYGQGIEVVFIHENSTGTFLAIFDPAYIFWNEETTLSLNYTPDTALKFYVSANINHTLFDFGPDKSENASARAIMRVGITVSTPYGIVYSNDDLDWDGTCFDDTATTWAISYEVVVDVIIQAGTTYVVRFTYEILS